jgi:hypothetical protein
MASESAADQVFTTQALSERILASLEPGERRAIGVAACACRGLRDGARGVMAALEVRELPHTAVALAGGSPGDFWRFCEASAGTGMPSVPPHERVWAFKSLTFVLQLRREDGRLFFTATAQPTRAVERRRAKAGVSPVTFVGAFAPGVPARFAKTDTASLSVLRSADGATTKARVFVNLPRQRIVRSIYGDFDDEPASDLSDLSDHTSDEDPDVENDDFAAMHWQSEVTRFEPRTLFFVTPQSALPHFYVECRHPPEQPYFGDYHQTDTVCTLACAIEGAEGAAAVVSATLQFCCGRPREAEEDGGGSAPVTPLQLTSLLKQLDWE